MSNKDYPFHSIEEETELRHHKTVPGYTLAFADDAFLLDKELRGVRLMLEYEKAQSTLKKQNIKSTVSMYGSSRLISATEAQKKIAAAEQQAKANPDDPDAQQTLKQAKKYLEHSEYYEKAKNLAKIISSSRFARHEGDFVVMTGGGPGIMEAMNRGAMEANAKSIGLSVYLPTEEEPNPFVDPDLHLQFHYFAIRKMHFLMRARALVAFPGGFGTLDELFEALTLMQTKKIKRIPLILFNETFWRKIINFEALVEENVIAAQDLELFTFVDDEQAAWQHIKDFYSIKS